jgi:hypothetical protein
MVMSKKEIIIEISKELLDSPLEIYAGDKMSVSIKGRRLTLRVEALEVNQDTIRIVCTPTGKRPRVKDTST